MTKVQKEYKERLGCLLPMQKQHHNVDALMEVPSGKDVLEDYSANPK